MQTISNGKLGLGSGQGGEDACDGVTLSHDVQACLRLTMASEIPGQNIDSEAIVVIAVTPWCPQWRMSSTPACRQADRKIDDHVQPWIKALATLSIQINLMI